MERHGEWLHSLKNALIQNFNDNHLQSLISDGVCLRSNINLMITNHFIIL